jgi:hypothetical protein
LIRLVTRESQGEVSRKAAKVGSTKKMVGGTEIKSLRDQMSFIIYGDFRAIIKAA